MLSRLAKLLTETVEGYGEDIARGHISAFYASHRDGLVDVNTAEMALTGIHSATASLDVIRRQHNGVVVEFASGASELNAWQGNCFLQCNLLSCKGHVSEVLFASTVSPLQVRSLRLMHAAKARWMDAALYVKALKRYDRMVHGANAGLGDAAEAERVVLAKLWKLEMREVGGNDCPSLVNRAFHGHCGGLVCQERAVDVAGQEHAQVRRAVRAVPQH